MKIVLPWLLSILLGAQCAWAGTQQEEALADPVRSALARAVTDRSPPTPPFANTAARLQYLAWLGEMSARLKKNPHLSDHQTRIEFLGTAWYEAKRAGLDPALLLGLIQVESGFRKYAVSVAGAQGFMQVMPFWSRLVGDGDATRLLQMQTNLRYGCSILRMYIDMEQGDLFLALGRYNGSRGKPEYPRAVMAAVKRWEFGSSH